MLVATLVAFGSRTAAAQERAEGNAPQPVPPVPTTASEPQPPVGAAPGAEQPAAPASVEDDHATIDNSPLAHDGHPLAGWHNGLFYLRDHHDDFRLYIQGRGQVDFYSFFGQGVSQTSLKPTLFIRRLRPEITGEILGSWRFMIAGDFGATNIDNPRGTNETAAAGPGAAPTASTARFAGAETARISAQATDIYLNYRAKPVFNVQVGQFDANFTMENRTSDKYIPFMERSLAVRAVGIPTNKEIGAMLWGETEDRFWFWSLGLYNGDGQNRLNVDARADVMARTFVHPLVNSSASGALKDLQVGGSFRYGSRDKDWVYYDYPGMTTQGNYQFWSPTYTASNGLTHIIPSGNQLGAAGELRIPIDRFDITSEVVWISNNTREALDGYVATNSERFGNLHGISYYAELGFWPVGSRDINGLPGYENPPHLDWKKADPVVPKQALQLLAKWEQVALTYRSSSRAGTPDANNVDGDIKVNALSFGANYWATKHVRLSLNYIYDMFPNSEPVKPTVPGGPQQSANQRALAPGNTLSPGVNDNARDNAHSVHELLARFAIAL